jgi:hypothetical protein
MKWRCIDYEHAQTCSSQNSVEIVYVTDDCFSDYKCGISKNSIRIVKVLTGEGELGLNSEDLQKIERHDKLRNHYER